MVNSGKMLLKYFTTNQLIHVTCTTHRLHRVAEVIREKYQNVYTFILCTKKIFYKHIEPIHVTKCDEDTVS